MSDAKHDVIDEEEGGEAPWEGHPIYKNALNIMRSVGDVIDFDVNVFARLSKPRRVLYVSVPVRMDDGSIKTLMGTGCTITLHLDRARAACATIQGFPWERRQAWLCS
ncbi:MAG: hypothetical protein R3B54_05230 [Bdellovibrionota bacterium]